MTLGGRRWCFCASLAALAGLCLGCAALPPEIGAALAERHLQNVAVLPVVNDTGERLRAPDASVLRTALGGDSPEALLRRSFVDVLLERGVAALEPEAVDQLLLGVAADRQLTTLAARGVAGLRVRVRRWDASAIDSMREMVVDLEVELLHGDHVLFTRRTPQPIVRASSGSASRDYRQYLWRAVTTVLDE